MSLYRGQRAVRAVYRGARAVARVYRGTHKVYEAAEPVIGDSTKLYFTLTSNLTQNLYFTQSAANGVTIDWGDGSATETVAETSAQASHTYAEAGDYVVEMTAGSVVTWSPGATIDSSPYSILGAYGSSKSGTTPQLTAFTFGEGCRLNESCAFFGATSLTSISIPYGITSVPVSCFEGCTGLQSIYLGADVAGFEISAITACTSLTSFSVSAQNATLGVIDGVLTSADKTKIIRFPTGRRGAYTVASSITSIDHGAFSGCLITSLNTGNAESIGNQAFYNCTALTSIVFTPSVETAGTEAFARCTRLTSIQFSNGLKTAGKSMFERCTALTSAVVPASITSLAQNMYQYCTGITSATIEEGQTTTGEYTFKGCTALTSATLPSSLTTIGDSAFSSCTALTSVNIPSNVAYIGSYAFTNATLSGPLTISAAEIYRGAFQNNPNLTGIWLRSSVTKLDVMTVTASNRTGAYYVSPFNKCTSLTLYLEASTAPAGWATGWDVQESTVSGSAYVQTYISKVWGQTTSPF